MGIFDSNRMLVSGLQSNNSTKIWNNQTDAVDGAYTDCQNYQILVLSVKSTRAESNILVDLYGFDQQKINRENQRMVRLGDSNPKFTSKFDNLNQYYYCYFLVDVSCAKQFRLRKGDSLDTITVSYYLIQGSLNDYLPDKEEQASPLISIYKGDGFDIDCWDEASTGFKLGGALENFAVWYNTTSVAISTQGIKGARTVVNIDDFPSILTSSNIVRAFIMPYYSDTIKRFRVIVITNKGQIYHNYPNRSSESQGTSLSGDEFRFDESVVWESPDRLTPVKTMEGTDATLISTGRYRYMPGLSDVAYELHPAINTDNGYSNGGFAATKTVIMKNGTSKTLGRFWVPSRLWVNNSFDYMGGLVIDDMLTVIGTYRSNIGSTATQSGAARTCVFTTQDGREWYNSFEFACCGSMKTQGGTAINAIALNYGEAYKFTCNVGSGQYDVYKRTQFIPDATNKEPEHMFEFSQGLEVSSIVGDSNSVVVTTASAHGYQTGDVIAFKKHNGATDTTMEWIENDTFGADSGGNGVFFRVYKLSDTTFQLHAHVHNPNTNIPCRHIHSVDRNKDGIAISCGEQYPQGWLYYMSLRESDNIGQIKPWYDFDFVRLNSARSSVQRGMGFYITQDTDNTVYIGIDNDMHDLGNVTMPTGRTNTFKRSSNGVWKGKLQDIDNMEEFENILPAKEVAYFCKFIEGVIIYIGHFGLVAVSYDWGKTWHEAKVPKEIPVGISRYGGITPSREVVIENLIITLKQ